MRCRIQTTEENLGKNSKLPKTLHFGARLKLKLGPNLLQQVLRSTLAQEILN